LTTGALDIDPVRVLLASHYRSDSREQHVSWFFELVPHWLEG
jgi:hypothetical protein